VLSTDVFGIIALQLQGTELFDYGKTSQQMEFANSQYPLQTRERSKKLSARKAEESANIYKRPLPRYTYDPLVLLFLRMRN